MHFSCQRCDRNYGQFGNSMQTNPIIIEEAKERGVKFRSMGRLDLLECFDNNHILAVVGY